MKRIFWQAAAFLSFMRLDAQTGHETKASPWQEDIKYFQSQLIRKHKNPFHHVTRNEFEMDIEKLYQDAAVLKGYEVVVRLMQITAKVGDGHTAVHIPSTFNVYPVLFRWFGDELRVVATRPAYTKLAGTKLLRIGAAGIEEINKKLATILSQDENQWYTMNTGPAFLMYAEIISALGLSADSSKAGFTFLDDSGKEIIEELPASPLDPAKRWIGASKTQPLSRQRQTESFWFSYVEEINAVYVNFRKYDDLARYSNKLFDFIEEKKATRLIVDLRQNGGGDFKKGRRQLISKIKEHTIINQKGNLFVITGRATFSAAMVNSIDFKKETNAIIIGEPPGEKPNSYSENDEMKLPNSGLVISYSTRYYKFLDEDVPAFEPDVRIDNEWKAFKEGRDPVMEWILTYCQGK